MQKSTTKPRFPSGLENVTPFRHHKNHLSTQQHLAARMLAQKYSANSETIGVIQPGRFSGELYFFPCALFPSTSCLVIGG
jgi:hypothetical protein